MEWRRLPPLHVGSHSWARGVSQSALGALVNIWDSTNSLLLFLAFFVPGFVATKVYDIRVGTDDRDWAKSIFEVVGYSVLNYLLVAPLAYYSWTWGWWVGWWAWVLLLAVLVLFPFVTTNLFYVLLSWRPVREFFTASDRKPWDYVFGQQKPYWVLLHMKDGRKIGGLYADGSFASSYPADEQIYISRLFRIQADGTFGEEVQRTAGAIVCHEDVQAIEFFTYEDECDEEVKDNG